MGLKWRQLKKLQGPAILQEAQQDRKTSAVARPMHFVNVP